MAPFISLNEHSVSFEVLVMPKERWDALSPEDQALIRQAAEDSVAHMRELWDVQEEEARRIVEEAGSQITEVDKQPFIDAMAPVDDEFLTNRQGGPSRSAK